MEYLPVVFAQAVRELQNSGIGGGCQFKGRFTWKGGDDWGRIGQHRLGKSRLPGGDPGIPGPGSPSLKAARGTSWQLSDMKKPPVLVTRGPLGHARRE
jgi:hypothetical protein